MLRPGALWCDVVEFDKALEEEDPARAVALYRGPFLDGVYVPNAAEFERWAEGERDRLARAYAGAIERMAEDSETSGDHLAAAEWWRRAASADPYSSRIVLRLMRALNATGERAAAIRAAEVHALLLRADLEVEPDPEVTGFVERLRAEALQAAPSVLPRATKTAEASPPDFASREPPAYESADTPPPSAPAQDLHEDGRGHTSTLAEGRIAPRTAPLRARRQRLQSPRDAAYYAGLIGILAGLFLSTIQAQRGATPGRETQESFDPARIAVLYFDDLSPGDTLGYLAHGLTERLVHELAQVEGLDVVSLEGVRQYRDRALPFDSMVADLRAGSIVRGSVMKDRGRLRVTVSLADANTGSELASQTVDERDGDLFTLMDDVVGQVAVLLRKRVGEEVRLSTIRKERRDARALGLVLQAEKSRDDGWRMAGTANARDVRSALLAFATADSLAVRAEQIERRWAVPAALRGRIALDKALLSGRANEVRYLKQAIEHAERALRLNPDLADALELRGSVMWRLVVANPEAALGQPWRQQAERDLRRSTSLDPHNARAWISLSQLHRLNGDFAASEVAGRRAQEEDPYLRVSEMSTERLFRVALSFSEYQRARELCREGRRQSPGDYRFWECELTILGRDPAAPASSDSAQRLIAKLEQLDPRAKALAAGHRYTPLYREMMLAAVLARAGQKDSARAVAARARGVIAGDEELTSSFYYDHAYVLLLLGERDRSAAVLDSFVVATGFNDFISRDPLFEELRR